jgi:hypothetical protein
MSGDPTICWICMPISVCHLDACTREDRNISAAYDPSYRTMDVEVACDELECFS